MAREELLVGGAHHLALFRPVVRDVGVEADDVRHRAASFGEHAPDVLVRLGELAGRTASPRRLGGQPKVAVASTS